MKCLLVWLFGDWNTIDVVQARWIWTTRNIPNGKTDILYYEIQYSEYFNKYRVRCFGKNAKEHTAYKEALNKCLELNNKLKK